MLPPLAAHIVLELYSVGAVIPSRAGTAIDFRGRKNKSPTLTQIDNSINTIGGHGALLILKRLARSTPAGCRRTLTMLVARIFRTHLGQNRQSLGLINSVEVSVVPTEITATKGRMDSDDVVIT